MSESNRNENKNRNSGNAGSSISNDRFSHGFEGMNYEQRRPRWNPDNNRNQDSGNQGNRYPGNKKS